jgi:hypothetical protein
MGSGFKLMWEGFGLVWQGLQPDAFLSDRSA